MTKPFNRGFLFVHLFTTLLAAASVAFVSGEGAQVLLATFMVVLGILWFFTDAPLKWVDGAAMLVFAIVGILIQASISTEDGTLLPASPEYLKDRLLGAVLLGYTGALGLRFGDFQSRLSLASVGVGILGLILCLVLPEQTLGNPVSSWGIVGLAGFAIASMNAVQFRVVLS